MFYTVRSPSLDEIVYTWACHFSEMKKTVGNTKEELFARSILSDPCNIWMTHPERKHNVAIQLAETLWVLSGRNDMEYLTRFLPRASNWSDNGQTWRAAYGPRLREYTGTCIGTMSEHLPVSVDQIQMTVNKLRSGQETRQAYISIWDPVKEQMSPGSKDYPCNVGIQYIVRDGLLHCSVINRSNDLIWGFSGINLVEFPILQRLMANWVGVDTLGEYIHYSNSLHVYESMYNRVDAIAKTPTKILAPVDVRHVNAPLEAPDVSGALELLSYIAELEMLYRTDPLTARSELIGYVTTCYKEWPEFILMFILPIFFNRPELSDTLKMFDLDCLHPMLKYNILETNALKHGDIK